jgi:hypothetical protein
MPEAGIGCKNQDVFCADHGTSCSVEIIHRIRTITSLPVVVRKEKDER